MKLRNYTCGLFALAVCCATMLGQTVTSSMVGTVVDPADAAITGAPVTLTNAGTGAVRTAITGEPGVSQVLLVGDGVHAVVDDAGRRIPELQAALDRAGVGFTEIVIAAPSIEDVFVALLESGDAT